MIEERWMWLSVTGEIVEASFNFLRGNSIGGSAEGADDHDGGKPERGRERERETDRQTDRKTERRLVAPGNCHTFPLVSFSPPGPLTGFFLKLHTALVCLTLFFFSHFSLVCLFSVKPQRPKVHFCWAFLHFFCWFLEPLRAAVRLRQCPVKRGMNFFWFCESGNAIHRRK